MKCFSDQIIVVPTDMSEFSLRALEMAGRIVDHHAQIHVVHVMAVIEPIEPDAAWVVVDEPTRREQTRQQLSEFLSHNSFSNVHFEVLIGNSGTEITEYAREVGAGLIIIPSHGRGPIKRLLLGSTTDRVVHLAHCPILVLKDEKQDRCDRQK